MSVDSIGADEPVIGLEQTAVVSEPGKGGGEEKMSGAILNATANSDTGGQDRVGTDAPGASADSLQTKNETQTAENKTESKTADLQTMHDSPVQNASGPQMLAGSTPKPAAPKLSKLELARKKRKEERER